MKYGFVKVAAAVPHVKIADCDYNEKQIEKIIAQAEQECVDIICFPELCITGYSCYDLFTQQFLLENSEKAISQLLKFTESLNIIAIVGAPIQYKSALFNSAVVIQGGKILGIVPKTNLSNNRETQDSRWFTPGWTCPKTNMHICAQTTTIGSSLLFSTPQTTFGVEIGEDLYAPIQPSTHLALNGAEIIFNPTANKETIGRYDAICDFIKTHSAQIITGYITASCGFGESTQDAVFAGDGIICDNGELIAKGNRFCFDEQMVVSDIDVEKIRADRRSNNSFYSFTSYKQQEFHTITCQSCIKTSPSHITRSISPHPFIPNDKNLQAICEDIFETQIAGLAQRIVHTNSKSLVIGISGGLDSTLALLVCAKTFEKLKRSKKDILGVTMPGFGTTDRTYSNAISLMKSLGVTIMEISIKDACIQHFKDINHNPQNHNVTYENCQARERTQILMDIANQYNGLVVGTGDLSELALGWATYNGDHMSNYGVNSSVPKTLIRHIVKWVAQTNVDKSSRDTLYDIIETPISPELIPANENGDIKQKTEDIVGPYELHDFFLYHFVKNGFSPKKIYFLALKAFENKTQYTSQYDKSEIKYWLSVFCRRFFNQQFKRSCMPDGAKVGYISLSPRGAWAMPSDATSTQWINECENLT